MGKYCRDKRLEYHRKGILSRREVSPNMFDLKPKKQRIDDGEETIKMHCAFIRTSYPQDPDLPKSKLLTWCNKSKIDKPLYKTINEDKFFRAIVTVNGTTYTSTYW